MVATSANMTENPLIYKDNEALSFKGADYVLTHDREIARPLEDSIAFVNADKELIFRLARGYAPVYLNLNIKPNILALGADLKNNIAISLKDKVILSQYTGNLEEIANYERFKINVEDFTSFFSMKPDIVACDKHPYYLSSNYAEEHFENVVKFQHHKAHFASVLFENEIEEPALGIILDGTGYGDDSFIWGGEFFVKRKTIERIGHIAYMPLAFSDKAVKEPYRLAMLWLYELEGEKAFRHRLFKTHADFAKILKFIEKTKTSSAGRLFDAVSAILGIKEVSSFEAEAAIALTYGALKSHSEKIFDYSINGFNIDFSETLKQIANSDLSKPDAARAFHNTFCAAVTENTLKISKDTGIKTVALSGGVFQNEIVFKELWEGLVRGGFKGYNKQQGSDKRRWNSPWADMSCELAGVAKNGGGYRCVSA